MLSRNRKGLTVLKKGERGSKNAYHLPRRSIATSQTEGRGLLWAPTQSAQGQNPASYGGVYLPSDFPVIFK